jgi:hypothetical protein
MWLQRQLLKRWPALTFLGLATTLVWGHTVTFDFVWDDRQFIQELESIRSLRHLPEMFTALDAQSSFPEGFKLFRPLRTLFYAMLYQIAGQSQPQPWIYHLANVLWHGAAAMLFFLVAQRLFREWCGSRPEWRTNLFALLISLAFAVHPVVSEVVCWAKSLDDSMAAVFTLAGADSVLKWNEKRPLWPALIWFTLAVYSKISAVPFPAVAFVTFVFVHRLSVRQACWKTSGFALVAIVFMVHRHLVIGQSRQTAPISGSYAQTLVDTLPAAVEYVRLLLGVPPFFIDYSFMPAGRPVFSAAVLAGLAVVLGAVGVAVWAWRRAQWRFAAFGLTWIGLFLLPVSNLMPTMQYMAERFLYLPLAGALLALGALALRWNRWQWSAVTWVLALLVWLGLAWNRSWIWKDELTLFVSSSQQGKRISRVEENAVAAIFKLPHLREIFQFDPVKNQAQVVRDPSPEQTTMAVATLEQAHQFFPEDPTVATALGILFARSGKPARAAALFTEAASRQPTNSLYLANLGSALVEANKLDEADEVLTRALKLDPANIEAWRCTSALHWKQADFAAALVALEKLKQLEPANPEHEYWIGEAKARLSPTKRDAN